MAYTIHPAAELFPLVEGAEFDSLVADIKLNGLIEPIAIQGNVILDGRNRLRACEAAGIAPHYKEVRPGTDALRYITSKNVHRRHMTTAQRAAIAAELANLGHGGDRKSDQIKGSNDPLIGTSIEEAATMMNVSPKSVKRAKKVMRENPEAHKAAKAGEKPAKQEPATLVWTDAVERILGDLRGVSRNNLTQTKAGWKPAIEEHLGHAIQNRVEFPSAEAEAIAWAFLQVLAEKRPAAASDEEARAKLAREELPKTAKEKLDSAIRAATRVLEASFEARVQARVMQLLNDEVLPQYNRDNEKAKALLRSYKGVLTRVEYKKVLGVLHPDRVTDPETKRRHEEAFNIIKQHEDLLCGVDEAKLTGTLPKTAAELMARRRTNVRQRG